MDTKEEMALIGQRLKASRIRARVSQEDAAVVAKVTRPTVSNWEAGRNMPHLVQFRELVSLYGDSVYAILFGSDPYRLSEEEAVELSRLSSKCSPGLQAKIALILSLLACPTGKSYQQSSRLDRTRS